MDKMTQYTATVEEGVTSVNLALMRDASALAGVVAKFEVSDQSGQRLQ